MIAITTDQMRLVDDIAVNKYNIILEEMMELAGYHLAELAYRIMERSLSGKNIVVLAGKGNNGGGGLVSARHLYNRGADVRIILPSGKGLKPAVKERLKTLEKLDLQILDHEEGKEIVKSLKSEDLIIDALIGYGLSSALKHPISELIELVNNSEASVLSLDVPTGLDSTKGNIYSNCIKADNTLTLALPKTGLLNKNARDCVGDLYLADIGIPGVIYEELGISVDNVFSHSSIIKISKTY